MKKLTLEEILERKRAGAQAPRDARPHPASKRDEREYQRGRNEERWDVAIFLERDHADIGRKIIAGEHVGAWDAKAEEVRAEVTRESTAPLAVEVHGENAPVTTITEPPAPGEPDTAA